MVHPVYARLRGLSSSLASQLPVPAFYRLHASHVGRAADTLMTHELVRSCRSSLDESKMECAHGVCHCDAVARDAGALVLVEGIERGFSGEDRSRLFIHAVLAGLLHDIKRKEQNHAVLGSIEAGRILSGLGMHDLDRKYIMDAIRNHEAFQSVQASGDAAGLLVSDALYDADKFRWGPENFTTTLWLIVESQGTQPQDLHGMFPEKMKGIERIKGTFRTGTGRRYGPEIVDQGISIGNAIYEEMTSLLQTGT